MNELENIAHIRAHMYNAIPMEKLFLNIMRKKNKMWDCKQGIMRNNIFFRNGTNRSKGNYGKAQYLTKEYRSAKGMVSNTLLLRNTLRGLWRPQYQI